MRNRIPAQKGRLHAFARRTGMFILLAGASAAFASEENNLALIGTLVTPPPCTLNGGDTVYVEFGDKVSIRKVASGAYRQPVPLDIVCEESNQAWQMTLSYSGTPALFDGDNATVVSPQQADLGIKLYVNNQPFRLNTKINLNGNALPELDAVLVQRADSTLSEGGFSAKATLQVAYE